MDGNKEKEAQISPFKNMKTVKSEFFVEKARQITKSCLVWREQVTAVESVWPDLAKFRQFGKILKVFVNIFEVVFITWYNFEPTLANFADFHFCKGQILNKQSSHLVTLAVVWPFWFNESIW